MTDPAPSAPFPFRQATLFALGAGLLKLLLVLFAVHWIRSHGQELKLCSWDCGYYREIATTGYRWDPVGHGPLAFFPLFPFLMRGLQALTGLTFEVQAIAANLVLFTVAVFLLVYWSFQLGLGRLAFLPAVLWTADRNTFWAGIPYTEPLFSCLLLSFLILGRSVWPQSFALRALLQSVCGMFAGATRLVGVALIAALGLGRWGTFWRRPFLGATVLLLGLSGILAFFAFNHFAFGAWSRSLETTAHWGRHFSILGFFNSWWTLARAFYFPTFPLLVLTSVLLVQRRFSASERWLHFFLAFIPLASSIPISLTRYLSLLFMGYVGAAELAARGLGRHPRAVRALFFVFVLSELAWQAHLLIKYFRGEVFFAVS